MLTEEKITLANQLIGRSVPGIVRLSESIAKSPHPVGDEAKLERLESMLDQIVNHLIDEHGPDENWFRDYYTLTGDHVVLTEYGWCPAELNTPEQLGDEAMEILDELNAPPKEDGIAAVSSI